MSRKAVELLGKELRARQKGDRVKPTHITLGYKLIRRNSDAAPSLANRKN
jgi:hypothetical protein